jgi:transcriptional regulator with XRE-family HTH domain
MFGKLLKEYRSHLKYTQEELAAELGISTNHLSRIELGKTQPSGQLIEKIISIFANDTRILAVGLQCKELYGIIFLARINLLDDLSQQIVFDNSVQLIDRLLQLNEKQKK